MDGDIWLDEDYDSGVPNFPGTRFVIDLKRPPLQIEEDLIHDDLTPNNDGLAKGQDKGLPQELSVLFVDDDMMIRKLFLRTLKRVVPDWKCDQAANGEAAILMAQAKDYDLVFVDQYMASIQKQLLGTETVRVLRSQGCCAKICGLSANDTEQAFLEAGADFFLFKPFKCEKEEMRAELERILFCQGRGRDGSVVAFDIP